MFCIEESDYVPYIELQNQDAETIDGLLIKAVKVAAHKVGIAAEFIRQPWLRCQALVKAGKAQSLMAMIKNAKRTAEYAFPEDSVYIQQVDYPIIVKRNGMFDNASSQAFFDASGVFDLAYYQSHSDSGLDAPLGYISYQYLSANKILTPFHSELKNGLHLVANGKLDGYVIERLIALQEIRKAGLVGRLTVTSGVIMRSKWYVPFNKLFYLQNTKKVTDFWHILSKLGQNKG